MAASALACWPGVQQTASQQLLRHLAAWQLHAGSPFHSSVCGCGLSRSTQQKAAPSRSAWPARVRRLQACGCNRQAYHHSFLATAAEPQRPHAWGPGHTTEVTTGWRITCVKKAASLVLTQPWRTLLPTPCTLQRYLGATQQPCCLQGAVCVYRMLSDQSFSLCSVYEPAMI